jgi:threonine dehydratase
VDVTAVQAAAERIAGRVHRTPPVTSATLDGRTGARVVIKAETLQKTGSFKPRGALNRLLTLPEDARDRGLIAISAGNHAAAVAWAAAQVGAKATVVMPQHATPSKVAACESYGAEVVLHGDTTVEAFAECDRLREERGLTLIHPFDDPEVVAGQGTAALELAEDAGPLDLWIVPVGGGGLACGTALAVRAANPSCRVIGVEPEAAATLTAALAAGEPVPITPRSAADGLCAPYAGPFTFPLFRELVDQVVTVSEAELVAATRFVMERLKLVAEPAGAAGIAALLSGKAGDLAGARVGTILSGGNLDIARVATLPGWDG